MRAARRHPELLTALRAGDLHLTAVSLLAPKLDHQNVAELVAAARRRTADRVRRMLADREPKPHVVSAVRRLPVSVARGDSYSLCDRSEAAAESIDRAGRTTGMLEAARENRRDASETSLSQPSQRTRPAAISSYPPKPLGEGRYLVRFTMDRELHSQLEELKALMRHEFPDGDVGKILAKAVGVLLKQVRARKFGECSAPRPQRHTRAWVSRAVRVYESPRSVRSGCIF